MHEHRSSSVRARLRDRLRRALVIGLMLAVGLPAHAITPSAPAAALPVRSQGGLPAASLDGTLRILIFYKTQFHGSQAQAREALRALAAEVGAEYGQAVEITETDNAAAFTPENLARYDTLAFVQTGGILFDDSQREALKGYIRAGGGFMGLHYTGWSAGTVSEHEVNEWYLRLVGAMSEHHPELPGVRPGLVKVAETDHPLTRGLPESFLRADEWYDWTVNPAGRVRTLLEAVESSYGGGRNGTTHPITWCQHFEGGRSWYTGMGHEGAAYYEPVMRTQMRHGLAYSAGLLAADCSPPNPAEHGQWSDVVPWPVMPINAALTADGLVQSYGSVPTGCIDSTPYDWSGNGCVAQGGQFEIDVWDPAHERTLGNLRAGVIPNTTYTDLFCSIQVQDPRRKATLTVGGDDGLGNFNNPVNGNLGVTSYSTRNGLQDEAPMQFPRWYPTATTMPNGDIVVQGGSVRGVDGPGVLTPERYTPDEGSGWTALTGATSEAAYGDGGGNPLLDENRWWYPRAFVAPGSGTLFTITGTQMFELDPSGQGRLTDRGALPLLISRQGLLGNPVGATSTAVMYRPGKILQVGGGAWSNGGLASPDGARAGFTVDITNGTAQPVISATQPMEHGRHWPTSTLLPTGEVLVTGGSRANNADGGIVTNAEIWNPDTGAWTTVQVPHQHARLYHSTALLLPDGRVMVGGGGAPGPRNYTDVEFYSPAYLFDGTAPAVRPVITDAPRTIGYGAPFRISTSGPVSRVTLVRNGSVTHGFNTDQRFDELSFVQDGDTLTIDAPADGTYAPPGTYMLFVFDEDGTPSVASLLDIDAEPQVDARTPHVVEQFEYPRVPDQWAGGAPPSVIGVTPGDTRVFPWSVERPVQLIRGAAGTNGGLGVVGYHLALGDSGSLSRTIHRLDPGREYRLSLRYARDSRSAAATGPARVQVSVGTLSELITADVDKPSQSGRDVTFGTFVGTFTASRSSEVVTLSAPGGGAGMIIDNLVLTGTDPGPSDARLATVTTMQVDPPAPSPASRPVTVSATVLDEHGAHPAGRAELRVDGGVRVPAQPLTDGRIVFPAVTLAGGQRHLEVRFLPSEGWRGSTASQTHEVERPPVGEGASVHYTFDEGQGTTAANSGTNSAVGSARLLGLTGWNANGRVGGAVSLPGGPSSSSNYVALPDDITAGLDQEFSVAVWARPNELPAWVPLLQFGSSTDTFFVLQSNTQANGATGFGATIKAPGRGQERLLLGQGNDLPLGQWTHVVFTMSGRTGKIYFNGQLRATRTDFSTVIGEVGVGGRTTANYIGSISFADPKFNGLVDDARLYGQELTAEEVAELYRMAPAG
jgi:large repetitive protein